MQLHLAFSELQQLIQIKCDLDKNGRNSYEHDSRIKTLREFVDKHNDRAPYSTDSAKTETPLTGDASTKEPFNFVDFAADVKPVTDSGITF